MALKLLNQLIKKAIGFLPDRGNTIVLDSDTLPLEFGRIIIERTTSGKIRIKVGDGTKKFLDLNYIGEAIIEQTDPTTIAVGGINAGEDWLGKGADEFIAKLAWAYQDVVLNSFTVNQSNVELGQPFNSTMLVSCNIGNIGNLAAGNSGLVYSTPSIFTAQQFDPRSQYTVTGISGLFTTVTNVVITVEITGANGEVSTKTKTIQVSPRMWWGSSALETITNYTELQALINNRLDRDRYGDYTFVNNFSHIGFPSQFSLIGIGFVDLDISTNEELFGYAIDAKPQLVIINDYGVQVTYNMYRSTYPFGGITKCRVK